MYFMEDYIEKTKETGDPYHNFVLLGKRKLENKITIFLLFLNRDKIININR